jgi:hypothetical protein
MQPHGGQAHPLQWHARAPVPTTPGEVWFASPLALLGAAGGVACRGKTGKGGRGLGRLRSVPIRFAFASTTRRIDDSARGCMPGRRGTRWCVLASYIDSPGLVAQSGPTCQWAPGHLSVLRRAAARRSLTERRRAGGGGGPSVRSRRARRPPVAHVGVRRRCRARCRALPAGAALTAARGDHPGRHVKDRPGRRVAPLPLLPAASRAGGDSTRDRATPRSARTGTYRYTASAG